MLFKLYGSLVDGDIAPSTDLDGAVLKGNLTSDREFISIMLEVAFEALAIRDSQGTNSIRSIVVECTFVDFATLKGELAMTGANSLDEVTDILLTIWRGIDDMAVWKVVLECSLERSSTFLD